MKIVKVIHAIHKHGSTIMRSYGLIEITNFIEVVIFINFFSTIFFIFQYIVIDISSQIYFNITLKKLN
jgi:hypothetical protein